MELGGGVNMLIAKNNISRQSTIDINKVIIQKQQVEDNDTQMCKMDVKTLSKMKSHWYIQEVVWRPIVRSGPTLTTCGSKLFLFGGYNKLALNDI